ncbi:chloride channel [Aureococcus anophagefferens]|nr:chloride channel [Aureococcus anophagefferens]
MGGHRHPSDADARRLRSYESIQYLPPNSAAYRKGARSLRPAALSPGSQRWCMAALIGLTTGCVGFGLKTALFALEGGRLAVLERLATDKTMWLAALWAGSSAFALAGVAAAITAYGAPAASSSGVPEVIAYLNGITIREAFNLRTALAKFASCACAVQRPVAVTAFERFENNETSSPSCSVGAVASGLAAGPEGPMIHLGAIIGRGLSQAESAALGLNFPRAFPALRNSRDLRDHVSLGAACGVSAAFGAPIGGLLFAAEEVASFWSTELSWRVFFACAVATTTRDVLLAVGAGGFGPIRSRALVLFHITSAARRSHVLHFAAAACCGVPGGALGALFIRAQAAQAALRARWRTNDTRPKKVLEAASVALATALVFLGASFALGCDTACGDGDCHAQQLEEAYMRYWCDDRRVARGAALLLTGGEETVWAVLGAASVFSGVTRLTISLTVILYEITDDVALLLPVMFAVLVSRTVAIKLQAESLYHVLLETKSVPVLLESSDKHYDVGPGGLDVLPVTDAMSPDPKCAYTTTTATDAAALLAAARHHTFPCFGRATAAAAARSRATTSSPCSGATRPSASSPPASGRPATAASRASRCRRRASGRPDAVEERRRRRPADDGADDDDGGEDPLRLSQLQHLSSPATRPILDAREESRLLALVKGDGTPVELGSYVHASAIKVQADFSLARALILYRTLGLRAIVVVDVDNRAVGMLTRQDLLPFHVNDYRSRRADSEAATVCDGDDPTELEATAAELADLV